VAFANLLNIFNPSCIILGGSLSRVGEVFLSPIRKTILRRALWDSTTNAEVLISPLGEEAIAIGAATQVLSAALARPSLFPPMEST
jgi:predicted NBD/HSP70 family sugar kinase